MEVKQPRGLPVRPQAPAMIHPSSFIFPIFAVNIMALKPDSSHCWNFFVWYLWYTLEMIYLGDTVWGWALSRGKCAPQHTAEKLSTQVATWHITSEDVEERSCGSNIRDVGVPGENCLTSVSPVARAKWSGRDGYGSAGQLANLHNSSLQLETKWEEEAVSWEIKSPQQQYFKPQTLPMWMKLLRSVSSIKPQHTAQSFQASIAFKWRSTGQSPS